MVKSQAVEQSTVIQENDRLQKMLSISLAYAPTADLQLYKEIKMNQGSTIIDALQQVGWLNEFTELAAWCDVHKLDIQVNNKDWRVGVYATKKPLYYVLEDFDRVEVYRPLAIDPMGKRKKRAVTQ